MDQEQHDNSNQVSKNSVIIFAIIEYTPQRIISLACFNERKRLFQISSFQDNQHYSNFQSVLIQLNPKQSQQSFKVFLNIKTQIKSQRNKINQKLADIENQQQKTTKTLKQGQLDLALNTLLKKDMGIYVKDLKEKKSVDALQMLIATLKLNNDQTNKKQFDLQTLQLQKFMKIDKPAINALQIFPKDMQKKILAGNNTLYEILSKCKTQIGTRCMKRWMKQPLQDEAQLNRRLSKVQYLLKNPIVKNMIQNQMKKLPDLDALYNVFYKVEAGKKSTAQVNDLIKIYRTVKVMDDLLKGLSSQGLSNEDLLDTASELQRNIKILQQICKMIEDNIIMDERDSQCHVRPDAQESLAVINKMQQQARAKILQHQKQVSNQLQVEVQKNHSVVYKYVFEADKKKSIEKVKQRDEYKYISAKQTKITFTTNTLTSLCRDLMDLEQQYKQQEKTILKSMYKIVAGYYTVMEDLSTILSQLDVLNTFATVINSTAGAQTPWVKPVFTKDAIRGEKIHHPCVKHCVPNNCNISQNKTVILTGPNMGGKSTYIRTIGVATYLAHIGCYVPAKYFQCPIIDAIITRVGASDMQIKGISTFMSEMIESSCMLQSSTKNSLVLIDQLGRGTSTAQGFGIAWAICQQLHTKINPYCLFATHFHEMTKMSEQIDGVCNMYTSCKITDNKLHLQYRVLDGKMEKSYGIQVARMLDYPQEIIENAQNYLQLYQKQYDLKEKPKKNKEKKLNDKQKEILRLYKQMKAILNSRSSLNNPQEIKRQYKQKMKLLMA